MNRTRPRQLESGFTLVEILIVVVILGILAAIIIPQFSNATTDAAASATKSQLRTIRSMIILYHSRTGEYPALGTNNDASDWDVLTTSDDPMVYLQTAPRNQFTNHVGIGEAESTDIGWVWDAANGLIWAPYFDEITGIYDPP